MSVLVTGAAGFIGFHVARALLARGEQVVGIDNLSAYYDPGLKRARLAELEPEPGFRFQRLDIAEKEGVRALFEANPAIDRVVHLAAQAGVRYSLQEPFSYVGANLVGHVAILEACRHHEVGHLVYASSSSVYGGSTRIPFALSDPVNRPLSLYAATKRADELMSAAYAHLFGLPITGLRFFTVYGPWGRPDMAAYLFARAIFDGRPIRVFNNGAMKRDFTYIDDIVAGVIAALDRPPRAEAAGGLPAEAGGHPLHRLYNLGNHRSESLMRFIGLVEEACGRKAAMEFLPMQPGDVPETFADIADSQRDLGFSPKIPIDEGVPRFVQWFRRYHRV
jgi:UDP-glucuronate 4-epimerase